jgi:hypothetical protein
MHRQVELVLLRLHWWWLQIVQQRQQLQLHQHLLVRR